MTLAAPVVATRGVLGLTVLLACTASAFGQTALRTHSGIDHQSEFGAALAQADVDADGFPDLITGAPLQNNHVDPSQLDVGWVRVWSGRTGDLLQSHAGFQPGARRGQAVAGLPDLDGDGHAEYAYAAPGYVGATSLSGRVRILDGATHAVLHDVGVAGAEEFGAALSCAGDTDGDGLVELIVGAPHTTPPGGATGAGEVWLIELDASTWSATRLDQGFQAHEHLGASVLAAGDLDQDGDGDVLFGAPDFNLPAAPGDVPNAGRIRCLDIHGNVLWGRFGPAVNGGRYGFALGVVDDISADGLRDVSVGKPFGGGGSVHLLRGTDGQQYRERSGDGSFDRFGWSLADAGDRNGDGFGDLWLGAPSAHESGLSADHGQLHLLSGATLDTLWMREGTWDNGFFGAAVVSMPDITGDGLADFAVSQTQPALTGFAAGRVVVFASVDCGGGLTELGPGLAGSNGVPAFDVFGPAGALGFDNVLDIGNSSGQTTVGTLHLGVFGAALPLKGGTLWLHPILNLSLPVLPPEGVEITLPIADDTTLCGFPLHMQVSQLDSGAVFGVSLSRGLLLTVGGEYPFF